MAELVTLEYFGAASRGYHVAMLTDSKRDGREHYHDYYHACYVVSGELVHTQEGTSVRLGAGDAFIVPPGFIHSLHFEGGRTKLYSLAFSESLFRAGFSQTGGFRFLRELQGEKPVRLRVVPDEGRRYLLESLLECLVRQQESPELPGLSTAPDLAAALVSLLAQCYYLQPYNADKLEGVTAYTGDMTRCVSYIDVHFKEPLTLRGLAKQFGLSQSAFCSVFPQFAGVPLKKYIAQKRIAEAQVLIRSHPDWPLHRVSMEVGYEDDSTFYRNFLRVAGVSPSDYRKIHRQRQ